MRRSVRNSILTILCGAMITAAASCATSQTYPVTVDGEKFRAGLYILEQQAAISEAVSKIDEEQPDLDTSADDFDYFKQTVEGQKFGDWVNARALENCREYVAVTRLFDRFPELKDRLSLSHPPLPKNARHFGGLIRSMREGSRTFSTRLNIPLFQMKYNEDFSQITYYILKVPVFRVHCDSKRHE